MKNHPANKVGDISLSLYDLHTLNGQIVEATHHVQRIHMISVSFSIEVSAGTERNLSSIEVVSISAQDLSKLAEDLQKLVSRFKLS
ncbi:methyl-accepting chemotaxis protein [Peribacillus acanthi]|uniref:methyl-accepting chemotaxis protein n=1 Tax=Peribacillus acanthi TaxID=2171554 RepID=UPI000D3ECFCB|nr:methyl-accepting chemotaxis protein [Peribacillus acanthi]